MASGSFTAAMAVGIGMHQAIATDHGSQSSGLLRLGDGRIASLIRICGRDLDADHRS
jgi:hypothetical protein